MTRQGVSRCIVLSTYELRVALLVNSGDLINFLNVLVTTSSTGNRQRELGMVAAGGVRDGMGYLKTVWEVVHGGVKRFCRPQYRTLENCEISSL